MVAINTIIGEGKPDKGGDFEAQRHWMEITVNLPIKEWYVEGPNNNMSWWGLDYPPLSAYWAWITGKFAQRLNPKWVALHVSRRCEKPKLKLFMRLSVILADLLIFIPSLIIFARNRAYGWSKTLWILNCPSLLLIDHGHFQYNTVILGLSIMATVLLLDYEKPLYATLCISCGVWFKQMGIYYVPAVGSYILRHAFRKGLKKGLLLVILAGLVGVGVTLFSFGPFLSSFPIYLYPVISRIFPWHRGLFEDKVANLWCSLAILTKFHKQLEQAALIRLCSLTTIAFLLPSITNILFAKPSGSRFLYALAYSSLVFFMTSYHVHEKNILIPQAVILLLTHLSPVFVAWFSMVSLLSLYHLAEKDSMQITYLLVSTVWLLFTRYVLKDARINQGWQLLIILTIVGIYAMPILQCFAPLPAQYPHLFIVGNTIACAIANMFSLCYLLYQQSTCAKPYFSSKPHLQ